MTPEPTVVAVLGATGTGKTELAVAVARALDGEIISVDSRLIYRGMDIGTAKPTADQRRAVPHHLIDVADPDDDWSLARYQRQVYNLIDVVASRRRLPLLVGGTGQHMRAVLEGWSPPPRPTDPAFRQALERQAAGGGGAALVERLQQVDPESADRIDPRNLRRVIRALEIYEHTGVPASRQRGRGHVGFHAVRVGLDLPRSVLFARLDRRLDQMLSDGLLDEVRRLLEKGYPTSLPAMSAIGYRQLAAHLQGEISLDEAVARIRRATRALVRRQANWFRRSDPAIRWFEPGPGYEARVISWLRTALGEVEAGAQGG